MITTEIISKITQGVMASIYTLITKGTINRTQSDAEDDTQRVQVDLGNDQIVDETERIQPFGLSSNPAPGAQAITLSLAGNRDHPIVIQVDDNRYRVKVSEGDVALYNNSGMVIELKGEEILLGKGLQTLLTDLDGVMTGQAVDTFTGIKMGLLPGGNANGLANSLKLKVEL